MWQEDEDHSPSLEFKVEIATAGGWPLFMKGTYNPLVPAISYALILKTSGRIYALDLGKGHKNPDGGRVGDTHKHRWSEEFKDKNAYKPGDITASPDKPIQAWQEFCQEARIQHNGRMHPPPPVQGDLFL